MSMGTLMVLQSAEMRRRRDSRGRYMEGEEAPEMRIEYGREPPMRDRRSEMAMGRYSMEEPDMRRSDNYGRENPGMRMPGVYPAETRRRNRADPMEDAEMRGEGRVTWDNLHEPIYRGMEKPERDRRAEGGNITDMRQYGRRYSPQSHMDDGAEKHHQMMMEQRKIGFQHHDGEMAEKHLTRRQAEEWVRGMKDGGKWKSMADVKQLAQRLGITDEEELAEFWALLNATYSDICMVAKKYNVDRSDFYADMAKALFLEDEDAVENKPVLYYEYLVKKDDD